MFRVARHWDPLRDLEQLRNEVNRLFAGRGPSLPVLAEYPAINLWRSEHGLALTAELPGVSPDDLDITVTADTVTLRGKASTEQLADGQEHHRRERVAEAFARTVELPFAVDPQRAEASYERGVLVLKLQRPEEHKPKKVSIKSA
jgi:HSP20 family protein